jgi:DNA-binding NarL/FixJ family response regulator
MRLFVYSRTRLFSECVASGLDEHPQIEACQGFWDRDDLLAAIAKAPPSALIVDLSGAEGWQSARDLSRAPGAPALLALSVDDGPMDLVNCAEAGCVGVIPYNSSVDETVRIVARALRGELLCSPAAAAQLMHAVARGGRGGAVPDCLTRREGEICTLVCEGMTNKEIARALHCSQGTVKNHVHKILTKLNLPRRSALWQVVMTHRHPNATEIVNGGVKSGHVAVQNQASVWGPSAMARTLAT